MVQWTTWDVAKDSSLLVNSMVTESYMTQTMPAVWVKDPTKVLKIVMRNPVTGGSF